MRLLMSGQSTILTMRSLLINCLIAAFEEPAHPLQLFFEVRDHVVFAANDIVFVFEVVCVHRDLVREVLFVFSAESR